MRLHKDHLILDFEDEEIWRDCQHRFAVSGVLSEKIFGLTGGTYLHRQMNRNDDCFVAFPVVVVMVVVTNQARECAG